MSRDALESIAVELETLRESVRERMNGTAEKAESDRLFLQILEINHRLQMINSILFMESTNALDQHVSRIKEASGEIQDSINEIERLSHAVNAIKSLLGIVDTVIDLFT